MSDDFDPNDFDAPRRDLSAFFSGLSKAIRNDERGYQAGLRGKAAAILAAYYVVADDFSAFSEMIDHECFADDEKVQSLDEDNYHKHLAKCVVKRSFAGSGAFSHTLSKFTTTLKHLVALEVEPAECAQTIKDGGGFKDFYEMAVAAKRQSKAASGSDEKGAVSKARSRSGDKSTSERHSSEASRSDNTDAEQEDDWEDDEQDEATTQRDAPPEASVQPLTVEYILANYLLLKMPTEEALDRYRDGPFPEGERRGLEIAYDGESPKGLHEWAFVSELELEDSDAPEEDNDNDTDDDEEEDAA